LTLDTLYPLFQIESRQILVYLEELKMGKSRVFIDEKVQTKAEDYHGGASYQRTQPDIGSQGVKSVNIELSFEEALKLSLAIQSCLMQLNRYKRSTALGREMGLLLSVKTESNAISVIEKRLKQED
jgi:hypothetical protein